VFCCARHHCWRSIQGGPTSCARASARARAGARVRVRGRVSVSVSVWVGAYGIRWAGDRLHGFASTWPPCVETGQAHREHSALRQCSSLFWRWASDGNGGGRGERGHDGPGECGGWFQQRCLRNVSAGHAAAGRSHISNEPRPPLRKPHQPRVPECDGDRNGVFGSVLEHAGESDMGDIRFLGLEPGRSVRRGRRVRCD